MKRYLILALILSVTSLANAALVLSFDDDTLIEEVTIVTSTSFVIGVYQDTDQPDEFWIGITGPASYSGFGTLFIPPAPTTMVANDGGYGDGWIHVYMPEPSTTGEVGKWWELSFLCEDEGDVTIDLYAADGSTIIDTILIHQEIPEPVTMALLGLGGLFLRRRK